MNHLSSDVWDYLSDVRGGGGLKRIVDLIESIKDYRVLLVGDYIKDEYIFVDVLGKSPKESMIAVQKRSSESWGGGVYAAAKHLAGFVGHVDLVTSIHSKTDKGLPENVTLRGVINSQRPLTKKTRFVERVYMRKLFEVYHMDDRPLDDGQLALIKGLIWDAVPGADLIMVTDFGHGLIDQSVIQDLSTADRFLAVAPQTNSANVGFNLLTKYAGIGVDYACLDEPEARLAAGYKHKSIEDIGLDLINAVANKLVITHGRKGCYVFDGSRSGTPVPALTEHVVDTVGAGDAFFSVTAPMVKAGGDMRDIGFIGNAAGALKVQIVGHTSSVTKPALITFITGLLK